MHVGARDFFVRQENQWLLRDLQRQENVYQITATLIDRPKDV